MADVDVAIALDTKQANKDALAFAKTLDDVAIRGVAANDKIRDSANDISFGYRYAAGFVKQYKDSINDLLGVQGTLAKNSKGQARGLQSVGTQATAAADKLKNYQSAVKKVNSTNVISAKVTTATAGATKSYNSALASQGPILAGASRGHRSLNPILSDQVGFWRFAARGAALYLSALVTNKLYDTVVAMESLNFALIAITGNAESAAASLSFLKDTASELGFGIAELGKGYKLLSAASKGTTIEGEATDAIFRSIVSSGRALGLSNADAEGSLRALAQMMSKGTVQSEELKGQLGERLPGAFRIASKAMGYSTEEMGKMLEQGKVMANEMLPRLALELEKTFKPTPEQLNGVQANVARMNNAFTELATVFGKAGFTEGLANVAKYIADIASSESTINFVKELGNSFRIMSENLQLVSASVVGLTGLFFAQKAAALYAAQGVTILGTAYAGLAVGAAAVVGYNIGSWAYDNFAIVRQISQSSVEFIVTEFTKIQYWWEYTWGVIKGFLKSTFADILGLVSEVVDKFLLAGGVIAQAFGLDKAVDDFISLQSALKGFNEQLKTEAYTEYDEAIANGTKIREEQRVALEKAQAIFKEMQIDLDKLRKASDKAGLSVGDYEKQVVNLNKIELERIKQIKDHEKRLKALQEAIDKAVKKNKVKDAADAAKELAEEQIKLYEQLADSLFPVQKATEDYTLAIAAMNAEMDKGNTVDISFAEKLDDKLLNSLPTFKKYKKELEELGKTEIELLQEDMAKAQDELNEALEAGSKKAEGFSDALDKLYANKAGIIMHNNISKSIGAAQALGGALQKVAGEGTNSAKKIDKAMKALQVVQAVSAVIHQATAGDVYSAPARMAAMAAMINSLGVAVGGSFGGGAGGAPDAVNQAALDVGAGKGTVLGDSDAVSESIAQSTDLTASLVGKLVGINTSMLKALTGLGQGISNAATTIAKTDLADLGGLELFTTKGVFEAFFNSFTFGTLGSLGGLIDDFFSGSSKKVEEGIRLYTETFASAIESADVRSFALFRVRDWKGSKSNKLKVGDFDDDLIQDFSLVFQGIADVVTDGATLLGMSTGDINKAFEDIILSTANINLKDLDPSEQVAALEDYFSGVLDTVADGTIDYLSNFKTIGEGAGETLIRLATTTDLVNTAVTRMNTVFDGFVPTIDEIASRLSYVDSNSIPTEQDPRAKLANQLEFADEAGGVEALAEAVTFFTNNFLSAEQKWTLLAGDASKIFEALGEPIPETREEFAQLAAQIVGMASTSSEAAQKAGLLVNSFELIDEAYSALEDRQQASLDNARALTQMYTDAIGKAPDTALLDEWLVKVNQGIVSLEEVGDLIANSTQALYGSVTEIFNDILGRAPSTDELDYWIGQVQSGALTLEEGARIASNSFELLSKQVQDVFIETVDRLPTGDELDYWVEQLRTGAITLEQGMALAANSIEGLGKSVNDVFVEYLGRTARADELEYWVEQLSSGVITLTQGIAIAAGSLEAQQLIAKPEQQQLEIKELTLLGNEEEALALTRKIAIEATHELNKAQLERIHQLEDEAEANKVATRVDQLRIRLFNTIGGDKAEALAKTISRRIELDAALTQEEKTLIKAIHIAEDATEGFGDTIVSYADRLAEAKDKVSEAYDREVGSLENVRDKMFDFSKSLRDFVSGLQTGSLSVLNPEERLTVAKDQFNTTAQKALAGDETALADLQSVAQTFLEQSQSFSGGASSEFASDFSNVTSILTETADMASKNGTIAEQQLAENKKLVGHIIEVSEELLSLREAIDNYNTVQQSGTTESISLAERQTIHLSNIESAQELLLQELSS